ncbi:MAG: GDP-mannose 4,6-dehydratase, partial [Bdellovibrionales bacterium]|nr:GDP-mannose 4,6-dehydratase [Bdellovibrionales bacterium]
MRVLITGGAGFIGSNLVNLVLAERPDWEITVLDALTYAGNFQTIESLVHSKKISFEKGDICNMEFVSDLFKRSAFDCVFHLAAESHVDRSLYESSAFVNTNVVGTQNLISAALATQVKRFIHVSTDEVYGSMGENERADESWPLIPSSPYSASKAASDLLVLAAHKSLGLPAVVTRCTNNYGPYQFPEKFIPLFVVRAMENKPLPLYGDGMQQRSWIFVR